jgi:hypothetical protein
MLADCHGLRRLMRGVVLTDLEQHRGAGATGTANGAPAREPGANARWYEEHELTDLLARIGGG